MKQKRSVILLFALAILVGLPMAVEGQHPWLLLSALIVVFVSGLSVAAEGGRRRLIVGVAILAPAVIAGVARPFIKEVAVEFTWLVVGSVALSYLLWVATTRFLNAKCVSYDTLGSAVAAYLLLGVMWSFVFALVWRINDDAFRGLRDGQPEVADFYYLSFVTMTTLGYGDVVPLVSVARAATVACAVTGQLYLAIMMAMVIGKLISGHQTKVD